jgi:hypothetical protein
MYNLHFTFNINRLIAKYTKDDPVFKTVKSELIQNTHPLCVYLNHHECYKITSMSLDRGLTWTAWWN